MSHRAATALPLILIAACSAAFLRAEQLKLRHSAVGHPHVRQVFSPGCTDPGCRPVARMRFTLRQAQPLTLAMVDGSGHAVKTLASHQPFPKSVVHLRWDGTSDAGAREPDGTYDLRVTLASGRNVTIPDPVVIDTVAPVIRLGEVHHGPAGLVIHYTRSKGPGKSLLVVSQNGAVVISRRVLPRVCHLRFADLTPGRYTVSIVGVDRAGNRTPAPPSFELTVP